MKQEKAAHVMTERQKKGALVSAKKPKPPKNILVRNEIEYWPSLDETNCRTFVEILEVFCSGEASKQHILIGLDSTLRHLKKNSEAILVIADEVSPRWFAKHLLAMALQKNKNRKIFIVPKLKDITKKVLNVPSIIFTIKSSAETTKFDDFYKLLAIHPELLKNYRTIEPNTNVSTKKKGRVKGTNDGPAVTLLKKLSDSSRGFTPMDIDKPSSQPDSTGFISFSKVKDNSSFTASPAPLYRPVKIMKAMGNPNRKERKT